MRLRVMTMLPAALLAACAPAAQPAAGPAPQARVDAEVPPVRSLLSERERLSLTAEQVVALDSIARAWQAAADALAPRRAAAPGKALASLGAALRSHALPTRAARLRNNLRAAEAVAQVLTPRQRRSVCAVQRLRGEVAAEVRAAKPRDGAARSAAASAKAHGGSRSLMARASRRGEKRSAWPWCTAAAPSATIATGSAN